jgi:putative peptidoglycan lipid II flippase
MALSRAPSLSSPADPAPGGSGQGARQQMLRSAGAVAGLTLLSRLSGLLREFTHAHFLGTGTGADAFSVALLIPNLLRRLVGEGAVSSAFVPVFVRHLEREGAPQVRVFAEKFFTLWSAALVVVTLGGMAIAGTGLALAGNWAAWSPEKLALTASLTRWLFPYLILVGLAAVGGGILNAFGIFAVPSATPLLYNLAFSGAGWLLATYWFPEDQAPYAFSIGVLLGGALQILVLLPSLWRLGIRPRLRWPGGHEGVREVLRLLLPGTFAAGIYQLNVAITNLLAMKIPDEGSVSALRYAARLMEFVLGVVVYALSTVSLTTLSRQAAAGDRGAFRSTLSEVIRLTTFITIPGSVGLALLGEPVISLVLQSGKFDEDSARLTASAFRFYLPGIFLVGLNRVLVSAFYSLKNLWTPVRVGAVDLLVNFGFAWALMSPLKHDGIALATTLAALFQAIWLLWAFARRERDLIPWREVSLSLARAAASAVVMGAVCWALLGILPGPGSGKPVLALAVGTIILAGILVYFGVARLLGAPEASVLTKGLSRLRSLWRRPQR